MKDTQRMNTDPVMPAPMVLTVKQTSKVLGLGLNQTYEAIRCGVIPSMRIGRRIIVPIAALDKKLEGAT
jgi:excisionase family DNA binding protein